MPKTPEKCREIREETRKKILHDAMLYFARNALRARKSATLPTISVSVKALYTSILNRKKIYSRKFSPFATTIRK